MSVKERIIKEIAIQKNIEGQKCQDKLLLDILDIFKTVSQWNSFIRCEHYRYGKLSYQTHRFYYPNEELIKLIKYIQTSK